MKADCSQAKRIVETLQSVQDKHASFHAALADWWKTHEPELRALPKLGTFFKLRKLFLASLEQLLVPQKVLDKFQVRGAFAEFSSQLSADFKSVAASGWNAELISVDEAERLILNRWMRTLATAYDQRLRSYRDSFVRRVETFHAKYAVTLDELTAMRGERADTVARLLKEFGYE